MPKGVHGKAMAEIQDLVAARAELEGRRVRSALDDGVVRAETEAVFLKLDQSIQSDTDDWKREIPAKPVLAKFASRASLSEARAKSLYISEAARSSRKPFAEIADIFDAINTSLS
jgi:hypothetical protein